jgi:hypothetical protein
MDWQALSLADLAKYVWSSGVSTNALLTRLKSLDVMPSVEVMNSLTMTTQALLRRSGIFDGPGSDQITERMQAASSRRFPEHLVSAHSDAVAQGRIGASVLAWMLGVSATELDEQLAPPVEANVDIDQLAKELGLVDPPT